MNNENNTQSDDDKPVYRTVFRRNGGVVDDEEKELQNVVVTQQPWYTDKIYMTWVIGLLLFVIVCQVFWSKLQHLEETIGRWEQHELDKILDRFAEI